MKQEEYVRTQYAVNRCHSNGEMESTKEEAIDYAKQFASWVRWSGFPCTSVLDAGCRIGYAMDTLGQEFPAARVVGLDIVPEFIEVAEKRGEAVVGDMQDMPFQTEEFDWVFTSTAIEHCPDARKAALELMRVAKYGVYCVTDLEDDERFSLNPSHFTHHNNPAEWVDVFRQDGWWLVYLNVPKYSRIDMIWVRAEHMKEWKKWD